MYEIDNYLAWNFETICPTAVNFCIFNEYASFLLSAVTILALSTILMHAVVTQLRLIVRLF